MSFLIRLYYALQIAYRIDAVQLKKALKALRNKGGCGGCRRKLKDRQPQTPNNKQPVKVPRLPTEVVRQNFTRLHEVT